MTDKQKSDALKMLLEGATYAEVGRKYMMPREKIRDMFCGVIGVRRVSNIPIEGLYPNLINWIKENEYGITKFGRAIGYSCSNGTRRMLTGELSPTKNVIDKILELTGMTYEECFAKEKAPEDAATSIKG